MAQVQLSDADAMALLTRMSATGKEFANHGNFALICIVYSHSCGVKLYTAMPTREKGEEMSPESISLFGDMLLQSAEMLGDTPVSIEYHDVNRGKQ